jgi:hypothetical protein
MRGWRRSLAVASALLALLPAAAAAQSAGDEQYEDPFGSEDQAQSQPQATATPAPAAPAQAPAATPAPVQPAPVAAAAPGQAELPRTGWDAAVPAVLGFVFVSAGVALRARVRRDA